MYRILRREEVKYIRMFCADICHTTLTYSIYRTIYCEPRSSHLLFALMLIPLLALVTPQSQYKDVVLVLFHYFGDSNE